ncbi:MAG: hypothetical protein QOK30_97 [Nocardioidaceae bacterium]|nr:hypothetical protein [Nocardioidaceae bacterium]
MSDPPDEQPIAPPRSLGRPPAAPSNGSGSYAPAQYQGQPQPAMSGQSGSRPSGDGQTERSMPVPPNPNPGSSGGGVGATTIDKRAEKQAQKASKRAQATRPRTVRRAKLRVVHVDPWSVTKASFLLSIAFGIMCVVAVFLIFSIMSASGLWDSVNNTIQGVVDQKPKDAFNIKDYVGMSRVMGVTMLISAIDVVIITALATLGAFIYNMAAALLGGVEITLAEDLR